MFESIYAEAFLDSLLNGDATLTGASCLNGQKAYKNRAPQGAVPPYVIYNMQSGGDVNTLNATRMFTRPVFQVRTVGKVVGTALQDAARVRATAHRKDEVLRSVRRQSHTVEGVTLFFNVWREDELPPREEAGESADVFYRNYSALYRVEIFS